ncbi:MAG: hypothetical protein BGO01_12705 [Armatimonadetes bacterium 55-13]|nr:MAG: hypothetical protein BGO01_12705 [Armatimonadetes bacterium 55-13]
MSRFQDGLGIPKPRSWVALLHPNPGVSFDPEVVAVVRWVQHLDPDSNVGNSLLRDRVTARKNPLGYGRVRTRARYGSFGDIGRT